MLLTHPGARPKDRGPRGVLVLRSSPYIYPPLIFVRAFFFFSFDRMYECVYATRSTREGDPNRDKGGVKEGGEGMWVDTGVLYV